MKRIITVILLLMTAISLFGCTRVIETPADELTTACWECENSEGSTATLSFSGDIATMTITDASGEKTVIDGSYSVDKEKLYITSHKLFRTFEFSYSAFEDRVLITYGDTTRTFEKQEIPANEQ